MLEVRTKVKVGPPSPTRRYKDVGRMPRLPRSGADSLVPICEGVEGTKSIQKS